MLNCHIDILIHRYLVQSYHIRGNDIVLRQFAYCYDTFTTCSNSRRATISGTSVVTKSSSLLSPLFIVIHSPINLTSTPIIQSYSIIPPKSSLFRHIVPSGKILWLSCNSLTTSLG